MVENAGPGVIILSLLIPQYFYFSADSLNSYTQVGDKLEFL